MSLILILALVAIATVILFVFKSKERDAGTIDVPYAPAKALFSPAERLFLGALDQAVGPNHRVFGKVRVADIANVKNGLSKSARQGALNRIAAKHVDFVVCRANDLSIVCALELNDRSHSSKKAQARDHLLAKICSAINLPLLTIPAKHAYLPQDLREQFVAAISKSQSIP